MIEGFTVTSIDTNTPSPRILNFLYVNIYSSFNDLN
jgi:hypothetical protein